MTQSTGISRRGALLVELLVCGALLGVVITATIPTLRRIVRQRKVTEQRQAAVLEVDNLMERLTAIDWDELTPERAAEFELSPAIGELFPEPRLGIAVAVDPDDGAAKQVRISLSWQEASGVSAAPVRLSAWVYRRRNSTEYSVLSTQ
ncbi:MAG: hypothetical protein HY290_13785 [Planctomycetia bacterium]|nr:hypothetical protein [Planctomycetia bacterium]